MLDVRPVVGSALFWFRVKWLKEDEDAPDTEKNRSRHSFVAAIVELGEAASRHGDERRKLLIESQQAARRVIDNSMAAF